MEPAVSRIKASHGVDPFLSHPGSEDILLGEGQTPPTSPDGELLNHGFCFVEVLPNAISTVTASATTFNVLPKVIWATQLPVIRGATVNGNLCGDASRIIDWKLIGTSLKRVAAYSIDISRL